MTTSRFEQIDADAVKAMFVSSEQPDTIGVEYVLHGNMLFDMSMGRDGAITVMFDEVASAEFPLDALRELLDRGEAELRNWNTRLSEPEGIWAKR